MRLRKTIGASGHAASRAEWWLIRNRRSKPAKWSMGAREKTALTRIDARVVRAAMFAEVERQGSATYRKLR